jgi:hypothetical protein
MIPRRNKTQVNVRCRDRYTDAQLLNRNLAVFAKYDLMSVARSKSLRALPMLKRRGANKKSKKMRLMTIIRLFAISVVLLSGTPAFAAREVHYDTREICSEQNAAFCHRSPFSVDISGGISNAQAKANAASKTWPGDMILG